MMGSQRQMVANSLEPWLELKNKVVMVTGATAGLGREFCIDLAKAGCKIIATGRRIDQVQSLCDEINNRNGSNDDQLIATAVELDVTASGPKIEASVKKAWDAFGKIDVLINNAGVRGSVHSPLNLSQDEWNNTVKTNSTGTWIVSKYVCTLMRDHSQNGGSVINIISVTGIHRGQPFGNLAYAASKAAVTTMTNIMALELGAYKIRVNSIAPGIFKSKMTKGLFEKELMPIVVPKIVPLRSAGTSDPALTTLIRYLIHDSSEYITGNTFIVESGGTLPGVPIFSSL